jgi:hypothetical protein
MKWYDFILAWFSLPFYDSQPSGSYCGSKTLFGESIVGVVNLKSANVLDFTISGDFSINCVDEPYSVSGNQILLTNAGVAGDCTHDALNDNQITLNTITYDEANNQIDVSVKYSVAKIDILLTPGQCAM